MNEYNIPAVIFFLPIIIKTLYDYSTIPFFQIIHSGHLSFWNGDFY